MKKSYYLVNPGRVSRRDNTLKFTPADSSQRPRFLPVEQVKALYVWGNLDLNTPLLTFLARHQIPLHVFDHYEHYTGSFMPKEYLQAGMMLVAQTQHHLQAAQRLELAKKFLLGGSTNLIRNLQYYHYRQHNFGQEIQQIKTLIAQMENLLPAEGTISQLMGIEGNIRHSYYRTFDQIIHDFTMGNRVKRPPNNEINALISFGNSLCYTLCMDQIYHTQLNPTISFLHEPGARRYSLALDLAEIFKPVLVDRLIFRLLNKRMLQSRHFVREANHCLLADKGRSIFLKAWDQRLQERLHHPALGRKVSYRTLVRLECYKLAKHCLGIQTYEPYQAKW